MCAKIMAAALCCNALIMTSRGYTELVVSVPVKTKCLQQAMATKEGIKVEEEIIERSEKSGVMNFFERWSRKKQAHRKIKK